MNQPECFGKLWDASVSECSGGYDPAFVGLNGSKTRPKCDFFDSCKTRLVITRAQEQQQRIPQLIPPQALMRPSQPMTPWQPQPLVPGRPQPTYQPLPQQQMYQYPQVVMPPMQMQATSFAMPAYLSTPEVRRDGESFWAPLGREVVRSLGKSFGHSIAHFFDAVSFGGNDE